jgi:hypothetical protein
LSKAVGERDDCGYSECFITRTDEGVGGDPGQFWPVYLGKKVCGKSKRQSPANAPPKANAFPIIPTKIVITHQINAKISTLLGI